MLGWQEIETRRIVIVREMIIKVALLGLRLIYSNIFLKKTKTASKGKEK